ncbi:hypothetical protein [Streptomyces sp. NPDC001876]
MVYKFGPDEQCLRRCRAVVPVILRTADQVTSQGVRLLVEYQNAVRPLMG